MKKPFVTLEQLQTITQQYPTPFHLYDEAGIRANARALRAAFAWNPGFTEYFAVKATPNPQILKLLKEEGCGVDCSSLCELMMSDRCGFSGGQIMFSSNDTPAEEFVLAAKLGATINLDDISHVDFLRKTLGYIPKKISCRFNPGGAFTLGESKEGFQVMDNPGQAKYGMTRAQLTRMNAAVMGREGADPMYGAPTILVVLADRNAHCAVQDGSLVMGNLMLAAASLGLGSCWINRAAEEFETEEGKALLRKWGIEGEWIGVGHCVLGYPAQAPNAPAPRKPDYIVRT